MCPIDKPPVLLCEALCPGSLVSTLLWGSIDFCLVQSAFSWRKWKNHDKWKAIFQSDFVSCSLWFKNWANYLAPHVKECISKEGALSRPTESDENSGLFRSLKCSAVHSVFSALHFRPLEACGAAGSYLSHRREDWGSEKQSLFPVVTQSDASGVHIWLDVERTEIK